MTAPEGQSFTVRVEPLAEDVRITIRGDVDLSNAQLLRDALTRALDQAAACIVIDLSGVGYFDSTGLNCLFDAAGAGRARGIQLRIERVQPAVARVLRIAHVEDVIEVADDD